MQKLKTFLVEDSPIIRTNLVAALHDLAPVEVVGYSETAEDACSQLRELGENDACDLAIVDIFLKTGSGLDVLRFMQEQNSRIRYVVLTNYATAAVRSRCADLGADRVFDKSSELESLVNYCVAVAEG